MADAEDAAVAAVAGRGGRRGGRGGGPGSGGREGIKVVVEEHKHKGIFVARGKETCL